jgi:hypothetical protein
MGKETFLESDIDNLIENLEESYGQLIGALENKRKRTDPYNAMEIIALNKTDIDIKAGNLLNVVKEIKAIKPFNPKKKY